MSTPEHDIEERPAAMPLLDHRADLSVLRRYVEGWIAAELEAAPAGAHAAP